MDEKQIKVLVTGTCGFIGSHLCERLLSSGYKVVGIDSLTDFYSQDIKRANIKEAIKNSSFSFKNEDILSLEHIDDDIEYIFHIAAQPGVRTSWGDNFNIYVRDNVLATQHLLELCKVHKNLKKFVYSSSSSIYGDAKSFPTKEDYIPKPISPYGVTKLAGEHLSVLYKRNYGVPITCLRYFTVFGPRQRPDMAFHRFIKAILEGNQIEVYGNGEQSRDFTYVLDVVEANIQAMEAETENLIFNIGGGNHVTVNEVITILQEIMKMKTSVQYTDKMRGDVKDTKADISLAKKELGFTSHYNLRFGLKQEFEWIKSSFGLP